MKIFSGTGLNPGRAGVFLNIPTKQDSVYSIMLLHLHMLLQSSSLPEAAPAIFCSLKLLGV